MAAQIFAVKGIPFFKFNLSHNGTTPESLDTFVDLDAFGKNTLSKELEDLSKVLEFIENKAESFGFEWNRQIMLLGHSRGGGLALLHTANDERVAKCATWASVSSFDRYLSLASEKEWLEKGVVYVKNGRTGQDMPLNISFLLDLKQNAGKLDILEQIEELQQDLLIVHGTDDKTVAAEEADQLYSAVQHAIKVDIDGADHTFNVKHPLTEKKIPLAFARAIEETIEFFQM